VEASVNEQLGEAAVDDNGMSYDASTAAAPSTVYAAMDPLSFNIADINTVLAILDQHSLPSASSSLPSSEMAASAGFHELEGEGAVPYTNEEYLRSLDSSRFMSIASFVDRNFEYGLATPPPPPVITRDHLQGDRCDMQGIEWVSCRTTRAQVRAKRAAHEAGRLSKELVKLRQVLSSTLAHVSWHFR
jgi:hypothetical protein